MKKFLTLLLTILTTTTFAQKLVVNGQLSKLKETKKIFLVHIKGNEEAIDSAQTNNGKFSFDIELKEPSIAILILDHTGNTLKEQGPKDIYRFFIEPGNLKITGTDSIKTASFSGLPILNDYNQIVKSTVPSENKLIALNQEFEKLPTDKKADENVLISFQDRYQNLLSERKDILKTFITSNPNSYLSLYYLATEIISDDVNVPEIDALYNQLNDNLKNHDLATQLKAKIDLLRVTGIGVLASDFEEKTPEGLSVKLSSLKGQYVLLDFWASWCGPCRKENPNLVNAYNKFKNKGFTILGVSLDRSASDWKKAIVTDNLTWTQLLDTTEKIAITYGIDAIPKNFLLDKEGKIIAKNLRGEDLEIALEKYIK